MGGGTRSIFFRGMLRTFGNPLVSSPFKSSSLAKSKDPPCHALTPSFPHRPRPRLPISGDRSIDGSTKGVQMNRPRPLRRQRGASRRKQRRRGSLPGGSDLHHRSFDQNNSGIRRRPANGLRGTRDRCEVRAPVANESTIQRRHLANSIGGLPDRPCSYRRAWRAAKNVQDNPA